jgi:hypothetical protein
VNAIANPHPSKAKGAIKLIAFEYLLTVLVSPEEKDFYSFA